ncbi:MAG: hypothetical protein C0456_15670 [Hyphomonas sp.]|uniref:hypothetical protein n=1 Tax=Hyphomonas sp. TaxID=87 RepID=UPI001DD81A4E|nr:hypothetical protein [Hyphomonas sp.]MBA4228061.1 hypothetical protein [Hyphomonas sp.]
MNDKPEDKIDNLISSGSDIGGAAIGGAIGLLGGPVGVVGGAAGGVVAARVLKGIGLEISKRLLGPREKTRIGATLAIAAVEIDQRIKNGETLRNDDFFSQPKNGRKKSEEFAEAILLKAQREAEEKKIPYLAMFLANAAFDSELNVEMAHQIAKAAESLTYRQFVLFKVAVQRKQLGLKQTAFGAGTFDRMTVQLMYEIHDLARREYLNFEGTAVLGVTDPIPNAMAPMGMGAHIYNYLRLKNIPDTEVAAIAAYLK